MRKRILSLVVAMVMLCAFVPVVHASTVIDSGTCGENLTWTLDDEGTLTISGAGEMKDYFMSGNDSPFYNNLSIKTVIIEKGVTSIGSAVFQGCSGLTSAIISDSVTGIGTYAFSRCVSLTSITIPGSVKGISSSAFAYDYALTSVIISNGVTSIGESVFQNCTGLISINVSDSVKSIGSSAFYGCESLKSINIPNGVTDLSNDMFNGCVSLADINLPDSIASIKGSAFAGCSSLTSIYIPDNVTEIGFNAFSGCSRLTNIDIPGNVTSIGTWAFSYCRSLKSINVAPDNNNFTSDSGVLFNKSKTKLIQYPAGKEDKYYLIPDSVTQINNSAFYNCNNLINIIIPDNVTSIDGDAFSRCGALTDVYYAGSEQDWSNKINIDFGNEDLINAAIHYNTSSFPVPSVTASVAEANGEYIFNVSLKDIPYTCEVLTALYDNGRLTGFASSPVTSADTQKTVTVHADSADSARTFIWDGLDEAKPLCGAFTDEITK